MSKHYRGLGGTATRLSRNPLGIIALFLVLVHGFAGLVLGFRVDLADGQRGLLVLFLILFPVLVLFAFLWLVAKHSNKLYGPGDFQDERHFVRLLLASTSLGAAAAKASESTTVDDLRSIVNSFGLRLPDLTNRAKRQTNLLWVDDHPNNNVFETEAFEAVGVGVTPVRSTAEALDSLERVRYHVIVSDMARREGPREGYALLAELRKRGDNTPFFIYSSSGSPSARRETRKLGGNGHTASPRELFEMVMRKLPPQ